MRKKGWEGHWVRLVLSGIMVVFFLGEVFARQVRSTSEGGGWMLVIFVAPFVISLFSWWGASWSFVLAEVYGFLVVFLTLSTIVFGDQQWSGWLLSFIALVLGLLLLMLAEKARRVYAKR